ncbi:hypothetical protein GCM10022415_28320 [Knoellia locipacati]|uniref:Uncharacterized protein n=1 Tax=Knoellia locipacati TaxID=882824 RepID=A0A512T4C5_9MICO|nr:hypothetical protein KLO01_31170 [Knoellia locipacati]
MAEEATRLLEALGRSQHRPSEDTAAPPTAEDPTAEDPTAEDGSGQTSDEHVHVAMGDAETCTWCPVCRSVSVLRGVSPETLSRLADLATSAATVLADLATRHTESSAAGGAARPTSTDRTPRTEPITVVDEEDTP